MAWNGSGSAGGSAAPQAPKKKSGASSPLWQKGALAGLVVVAIGAVVLYFSFSGNEVEPVEKPVKTFETIKQVKAVVVPSNRINKVSTKVEVGDKSPKYGRQADGTWRLPERKKVHGVVTNHSNVARQVPYRNGPEQLLHNLFSKQLGDMPAPLPILSDASKKRLVEILIDKNPPSKDDDEFVAEGKIVIDKAKKLLAEYIRDGGDVDMFFEHYHRELMRCYQERSMAQKAVFESAKTEDAEVAESFCKKVNETLEAKGIRPVVVPTQLLKNRKDEN